MCDLSKTVQPGCIVIVFEGINGSGKTTRLKALETSLKEANRSVKVYKFPDLENDPELKALLEKGETGKDLDEAFVKNIERRLPGMRQALTEYEFMLIDRFWLSTLVYANTRGADFPSMIELMDRLQEVMEFPVHELIFVDVDPKVAHERLLNSDREPWRIHTVEQLSNQLECYMNHIKNT